MKDDREIELLVTEYQECNSGYAYRDQLAHNSCRGIIQTFSIFLTLLLAITIFIEVSRIAHICLCVVVGFAGLCAMSALLLDMESTMSCKVALRERCLQIEKEFVSNNVLKIWDVIERRRKFCEEKMLKGDPDIVESREKDRQEPEQNFFVNSTRVLIVLWVVLVVSVSIWGPNIRLTGH